MVLGSEMLRAGLIGNRDSDRNDTSRSETVLGWAKCIPESRADIEPEGKDLRFDMPIAGLIGSRDSERGMFSPWGVITGCLGGAFEESGVSDSVETGKGTG
jgi:hypothetical protein